MEDIIHNSMTNFGTGHIFDGIPDKSLPDKLIPLNLQKLIYAYQHKTASPTPTIFLALMTVLSAVYSSNIDVEGLSGRRIPLNFYGLIMSGTGDGKSSAVSAVLAPVLEFEKKINESYVRNMIDFKAEKIIFNKQQKVLEKRLEKAIENESKGRILLNEKIHEHLQECPKEPISPKILLTDASLRGLRDALVDSGGSNATLLVNPDAAGMINDMLLKYASNFCGAWSGDPINIVQAHVKIYAPHPRLSMLLMVQPELVEDILDNDHKFITSGLAARFFIYNPASLIGQKQKFYEPLNDEQVKTIEEWENYITHALEKNRFYHIAVGDTFQKDVIKLDNDCIKFLKDHNVRLDSYMASEHNEFDDIKWFAVRIVEHSCRIAAHFELFNNPDSRIISFRHLIMAFDLTLSYARSLSHISNPDRPKLSTIIKAQKILSFLLTKKKYYREVVAQNGVSYNVIRMDQFQRNSPVRKKSEYNEALRLLEQHKIISVEDANLPNGMRFVNTTVIYILQDSPYIYKNLEFNPSNF
ncbi:MULTISPECIES: DUF3987 domain-containing protein [Acidithiobacillus]|uniref:DUF3987 domain-containing protein n=1 Tax=Acidithiobacillus thiooxidans ATCC 19377 TaxID=637390 RepID=A0A5P9XT44_ACITH|nr:MULTISPECIES: DUF3987 domain-containing protein [Acidithiobacillus]MBU2743050.1 DUF3987 domain-containing protein [Acidithiobacillus albertensis]MBU2792199.1 DUF3987 domain-containing protein [Acidithiobacillus thiooxidans]MDA8154370.1 DUF3987 domain-containing protein [Acidithiobacillus sp.]QFX96744.1 hypothetical protein GCD22_02560 [Acidithiobacillus thiooxidans ATCC 19377]